jgi:signal transduction histidine kinase/FixJ family two-component response regulator
VICGIVFFTVVGVSYFCGGMGAPQLLWMLPVPIVGLVLCGNATGFAWLAMCLASYSLYAYLGHVGYVFPQELAAGTLRLIEYCSLIGIAVCVFLLTHIVVVSERQLFVWLEAARQQAEDAARSKTQFLCNVSHELRTPMTAILGFTEQAADDALSRKDHSEALAIIERNACHLLKLIDDVLDVSRIEAAQFDIRPGPCDPGRIVRDVVRLLSPGAAAKGLRLGARTVGAIPRSIQSDPTRLKQALVNLVGNAIKFTQRGSVEIVLQCDVAREQLSFHIADTGPGIRLEMLDAVFEPFTQEDCSTTRRYGGTGLGLSITRSIARALGGEVSVRSEPAVGCTFTLSVSTGSIDDSTMTDELPQLVDEPPPGGPPVESLDCRVLLVEDSLDNQRLLATVLSKAGADVTVAANGVLGVEYALDAAARHAPYDVILMDMQMPVMDGYTATQRLRGEGYRGAIVALTAHVMPSEVQRCLGAGCDAFLAKPIDRETLIRSVADHVRAMLQGKPDGDEIFTAAAPADRGSARDRET